MVFTSLHFVAFFLVVYGVYRLLPHRGQNYLLLAASYYFYASWDWRFLSLLVATTLVAYSCGAALGRLDDRRRRKQILVAGVVFNLAILGFFKYFNFFADNFHALLALAGWRTDGFTLKVLLPIGISFYTFVAMGYVIDVSAARRSRTGTSSTSPSSSGHFPRCSRVRSCGRPRCCGRSARRAPGTPRRHLRACG